MHYTHTVYQWSTVFQQSGFKEEAIANQALKSKGGNEEEHTVKGSELAHT